MPTFLREGPYRFFIYSQDCEEPSHIHVERDRRVAKFWLEPIRLAQSGNFQPHELRDIEKIIRERHTDLMKKWRARCS